MPAGQGVSDDHARSVDAQMELLPATRTAASMFHGGPFTFTYHRGPGPVDDKMDAGARGDATQREVEPLRPPRQCCVIGCGEVEAQQPEDRPQKALRLAEGQLKTQAARQRGFDGDVRVLQLPAPLADTRDLPPGDRLRRQPEGDVAPLNERSTLDFTSRSCDVGCQDGQGRAKSTRFRAPTPRAGELDTTCGS